MKDVPADKFVSALAQHLKSKMKVPGWADIVKTAHWKELAPINPDWYFVRAAAVARRVYLRGGSPAGLAKAFGGRQRRGARKPHFAEASTGLLRKILQQLEEIGLVAKADKGRKITAAGQRELDTVAGQIEVRSILTAAA